MIPNSFKAEIVGHIGRNVFANRDRSIKAPLILCISGPPGMGKTYQTHEVLRDLDVAICDLPGSAFENESAGAPAEAIQECYRRASSMWAKGRPAAIVIDDVDAAIGQWGELTQYTVNRQLVCGTLMALADNPYVCYSGEGAMKIRTETYRVPIIMTCNDSGKLYAPLMRPGRTRSFVWVPGEDDRSAVVQSMFPDLEIQEVRMLIDALDGYARGISPRYGGGVPVSLYSDILAFLEDEWLHSVIDGHTAREMMSMDVPRFESNSKIALQELIERGKMLLSEDRNYLEA